MGEQRKDEGALTPLTPLPDAAADGAAADAFCAGVAFDEIGFATWCNHHSSLDLTVPLFISAETAGRAGSAVLRYSITVRPPGGRERRELTVNWFEPVFNGQKLHYPGHGDRHDTAIGDLYVILRISA